ncbi:MAG: hypothetical protein VR68_06130 [Peptococcaceae bacterium BRH_c4a]|nr:MAG: hypothetical protein VR68_06130 [Peptococcaceae bacterium BRH_c4a]
MERRQYDAIKKERNETAITGIIKGFFYLSLAGVVYFLVFFNANKLTGLLTAKNFFAPLISMSIVVLVAYLLGTGINKLIKNTLEQALESQKMREE